MFNSPNQNVVLYGLQVLESWESGCWSDTYDGQNVEVIFCWAASLEAAWIVANEVIPMYQAAGRQAAEAALALTQVPLQVHDYSSVKGWKKR